MHTNHRRPVKARQEYPWDNRGYKVKGFRFFRSLERRSLERVRAGNIDPDEVNFPTRRRENDDVWNYD